jgi:hypothetical protein
MKLGIKTCSSIIDQPASILSHARQMPKPKECAIGHEIAIFHPSAFNLHPSASTALIRAFLGVSLVVKISSWP